MLKLLVIGFLVPVIALTAGVTVTYVSGQFCETQACSDDPFSISDTQRSSYFGWPLAWKIDGPRWRIDQIHEAYGFGRDGVSPLMFAADVAANSFLAWTAEALLISTWYGQWALRRFIGRRTKPPPHTTSAGVSPN